MSTDATTSAPHSVCLDCGLSLATKEDASAHGQETFESATPDEHGFRRGHTTSTINPSEQERRAFRAECIVDRAFADALDEVENNRGDLTDEEILSALGRFDLATEWAEAQR